MILISLLFAAATTSPAVKPDNVPRREARDRPAPSVKPSKRLIDLEAAVRSLPLAAAEPSHGPGPKGM